MTTARQVAAGVLHRSRSHDAFAAELVYAALAAGNLSPQDRLFVTQLVFGVIRRSGTLDALLRPFIKIPLHAVQPRVWDVLRLGAFQLTFLTHVPKHAAVHETVELATHIGAPKAKGFVNGVLRRIAELVTDEFTEKAARDAVPFEWLKEPHPPAPSPRGRGGEKAAPLSPPLPLGEGAGGWGRGRYRKLTQ